MAIFIPLVTKFDDKGLQGAQRALAQFQNFAVDVGRIAATAIAAVGVASVREAAQFENAFTRIRTLTSLSAEDAEYLQKVARDIGPAYGVSAREAAEGLYFITSAGYSAAESSEILEAALKAEFIGMGDVATIADLVTSALYSFGDGGLTAESATNSLLKAIRAAKAEPEELAASMGRVLPIASEMGISFAEAAALAGILSQGGLDASEAMTALRGVMTSLLDPTAEAEKTLGEYGFTAQDVRDRIGRDGLFTTLNSLNEAFGGNEEAVTSVFGEVRALVGVLSLMGNSLEENSQIIDYVTSDVDELSGAVAIASEDPLNKFNIALENSRDSLLEVGSAVLDRLIPHLDSFSDWMEINSPAIEDAFIEIFAAIDQIITSEALGKITQGLADMWPEIQEVVYQFGELVNVLIPLVLDAIERVLPLFKDSASVLGDIVFFVDEIVRAMGGWGEETPGFVDFLERNLNPIARLGEAMKFLAEQLNAARTAYERFKNLGFDPGSPARDIPLKGRRAGGGPVTGGSPYLVGELGPEIFVPSSGGRIIPNDRVSGGATINITVNAGLGANGSAIGQEIVSLIKRYERTSGPVFASA